MPKQTTSKQQSAADAERMVQELEQRLRRHAERRAELEAERKVIAFNAHALQDAEARRHLSAIADEAMRA